MYCIYCNKEKPDGDFTREHVIPKNIGGNFEPINPFLIKVCKNCNSLAGRFIDAPFTRSFFIKNSKASNAKQFVDLTLKPILPLTYIGILPDIKFQNKICEFWMGPAGDLVYHFYDEYTDEINPLQPGSLGNKKKYNGGFVFFFLRATNPNWHYSIIYSIIENFKGGTFYFGNSTFTNEHIKKIPADLSNLHQLLIGLNKKTHTAKFTITIDFEERFLAKLALGLGCIFLHKTFGTSNSANSLREFLWEKDRIKRQSHDVKFTSALRRMKEEDSKFMKELFSWKGGHLIALFSTGNYLVLYVTFYETHMVSILISDNRDHWVGLINDNDALLFVLVPGLKRAVRVSMGELVAFEYDNPNVNGKLGALWQEMMDFQNLEPYMI